MDIDKNRLHFDLKVNLHSYMDSECMDLSIRNVNPNSPVDIDSSKHHFDWKASHRLNIFNFFVLELNSS